jgi:hypothetical protein
MSPPIITLLTDFGTADAYAGIMKGVILGRCPDAVLVDLTHGIAPQDVLAGALVLRSAVDFFPAGTIHLAVVDPGVGSARAAVLVETPRACLIGPDNGLLAPAAAHLGIARIIELADPAYRLPVVRATFHGRDIFAPAAAHLAAGVPTTAFGPPRAVLAPLALPATRWEGGQLVGEVIRVDGFGNLVTNIGESALASFRGGTVSVSIAGCTAIPLVSTYADVAPGQAAALIGSWGQLEIAVRGSSAAAVLGAKAGTPVRVVG